MYLWDYKIEDNWLPHNDLEWEWFLVRKINYDDYQGLKKEAVKKYFPAIRKLLEPAKEKMLAFYLGIK